MRKTDLQSQLHRFALGILLSIGLLSAPYTYSFKPLDRSIAIVDEGVILNSELKLKLQLLKQRMGERISNVAQDTLRQEVLDHLILERLQLQMARRAGMQASEAEITKALTAMESQLLSRQQLSLEQYLTDNDMTLASMREQIRRELIVTQLQQRQVNRRIRVSEQEIENFLNSKDGKEWSSPQYRLSHILIAASDSAAERAQQVYSALQQQADFGQVAANVSNGNNASQGGDLGWRKASDLPELFVNQVRTLNVGDITPPFNSGAGVHILKVVERRGAEQAIIDQAKVRHILIKTSTVVSDSDAQEKLRELRRRTLNGEDFKALAKAHSEDIGSMLNGGDLGWSTPGQFVPAFEDTMNKTQTGELSQPFRSQFGWHILYVEERRRQDMTHIVKRNQAANLLRKRRFNDELRIWLQEIRDNAYVEILI